MSLRHKICNFYNIPDLAKIIRDTNNEEFIEESIMIDLKRKTLIKHLLDREAYEIDVNIFEVWLHNNRPCPLKEVKYAMERGLSDDSVMLYLRIVNDIDVYY